MFWAGLFLGLFIGIVGTVLLFRFSINYVLQHDDLFNQVLNPNFVAEMKQNSTENPFVSGFTTKI